MAVGKYEMFICKNYSFELFVFRDLAVFVIHHNYGIDLYL